MKKILILVMLCSCVGHLFGATYYVNSKTGNDANNGRSATTAWLTLNKVNSRTFVPGDSILFSRGGAWKGQLAPAGSGMPGKPIVFGAYGTGALPEIKAAGNFRDAVLLKNIQYIVMQDMDISNWDSAVAEQKTGPTGVRILAENIGTLHDITLRRLYVHDINGDNKKGSAEGCGIFWDCQGPKASNIVHLVIEDCKLKKVDRNGIRGNGTFGIRSNWFPNRDLIIRNCLLDDIGGDGIVVKAFDTAMIEHNKLINIRTRAKDNAVAIWPHSSDHTTIQYNEVAYTKNLNWANDGQSFDIDGNCRNTVIQYNYSHDNDGGFMLVISDLINNDNVKTTGNIIRYNLSVNDGQLRRRLFNFAGVTDSTLVKGNIFYNDSPKHAAIEIADIEGGFPTNIAFDDNYFYFGGKSFGVFTKSPKQYSQVNFTGNILKGNIAGEADLVNVKETLVTGGKKNRPSAIITYPWKYMPQKLKSMVAQFPVSLQQSIYGKTK